MDEERALAQFLERHAGAIAGALSGIHESERDDARQVIHLTALDFLRTGEPEAQFRLEILSAVRPLKRQVEKDRRVYGGVVEFRASADVRYCPSTITEAAELMGVDRKTARRRLKRYVAEQSGI